MSIIADRLSPECATANVWDNEAAQFYVRGLEQSDYVERMGAVLRPELAQLDSLLDIGAGAGTLAAACLAPNARWTALEPNQYLLECLARLRDLGNFRVRIEPAVWQDLPVLELPPHQAVLAANMVGPLDDPQRFWRTLAPLCQRRMIWTVPAQRGPRQACLSGALPPELHGEDETPAVDLILARLPKSLHPHRSSYAHWTFRYTFADFAAADAYFQGRFNPSGELQRRQALRAHLECTLEPGPTGLIAAAPKRGAFLIWDF